MKREELKNYLLENVSELIEVVSSLNSWNGSCENIMCWENDEEFFSMFFGNNPMEAVRATCYGDFNYMDPLVRFNAYGNLESLTQWDYEEELKGMVEEIIDGIEENYSNLYLSSEIEEFLEEEEDEE